VARAALAGLIIVVLAFTACFLAEFFDYSRLYTNLLLTAILILLAYIAGELSKATAITFHVEK